MRNVRSVFALPIGFLLLVLALAPLAEAAREAKFKDLPLEWAKGDRFLLQGLRGSVRLIQTPPNAKNPPRGAVARGRRILPDGTKRGAQERFDSLSFSVHREGSLVVIEVRGPTTKSEWLEGAEAGMPELAIEIEAPFAIPAEVHLRSGTVSLQGWKDSATITVGDGAIRAIDTQGSLQLSLLRGEVKIEKHKGDVALETHAGKVQLSGIEGSARVHNFAGETSASGVTGKLTLRSKAGATTLSKVDGGFEFDNGRGAVNGTAVGGDIRGVNDDGAVNLALVGETDAIIDTQDGSVSIKPPSGFGVLLRLSSEEGAIAAPASVNVPKVAGPKSVVSRLDGTAKGTVVVRSKRGLIRIK